jgi:hypothetical protein
VPRLAELAAAADVSHDDHTTLLGPQSLRTQEGRRVTDAVIA